jgi:hypothetical protein
MRTIEWVEVTQEDLIGMQYRQLEAMPAELRQACPYCHAGIGYWCMTSNGDWAKWSHKARVELMASP